MKRVSAFLPAFSLFAILAGCRPSIETVATVGPENISREDFRTRLAESFGTADSVSPEMKRRFLDEMIRARLEILEAKRRGLDADSSILRDVASYRVSLAQALLLERDLIEPRLKVLYARKLEELRVSQIFFRLPQHPTPAETLEVYGKALHLVPFIPIVGFDALAKQYSEDTLSGRRGGDVGWITGGTMEEPFEAAAYALHEGEYSKVPVRTSLGYHLILILKRQQARGAVHVSHIVRHYNANSGDTSVVRDTVWMIYNRARRGEDFAALAREYSDEKMTRMNGGDMGFFERDDMRPELSNLLYGLPVDSVTLPQRTRYVYQIYKITGYRGIPSFDEMHNNLRSDYEQMYYQDDYLRYIQHLRRTANVTVFDPVWHTLTSSFDGTKALADRGWDSGVSPGLRTFDLVTVSGKRYTVSDFLTFVNESPEFRMIPLSRDNLDQCFARYTEKLVLDERARTIPVRDSSYSRMVAEYEKSLLIQRLEKEEVTDKVVITDPALHALYDSTKENYRWPDRVNLAEIYVATDTARRAVIAELDRGDDFLVVAQRHTVRTGYSARRGIWGLLPDTTNPLTRLAAGLPIDSVTGFFEYQNGLTRIKTLAKEPSRLKTFDEVRPELEKTCRDLLLQRRLDEWLRSLRQKYGVSVNDPTLAGGVTASD